MDEKERLAAQFEADRPHLRAVAYRMLGSLSDADDAVQESWLHLSRSDTHDVVNLTGWLTTVVARVCLDMLRTRKSRREETLETRLPEPVANRTEGSDPEYEAILADSVGLAMLVVLERLAPAERLAFVLHDMFALSFEEIGPIVGRTSTAARQLASRARRRVQGAPTVPPIDLARQREVISAFFAASRGGDFDALLTVLDPDVVFQADSAAVRAGGPSEVRGATAVARLFSGRAHGAKPALVNGAPGAVVAPLGHLFLVLVPTIENGRIVKMEAVADPEHLRQLDIALLPD